MKLNLRISVPILFLALFVLVICGALYGCTADLPTDAAVQTDTDVQTEIAYKVCRTGGGRIEGWNTESHAEGLATAEVKYKDRVLTIKDNEYYLGENKDEVMSLHFWGPKDSFDEEVYIIFKLNGEAKKLLVVTPPTNAE
jgi:hypothetical protein